MKEILKSFGKTFGSTLLPIFVGVSVGSLFAVGLVYLTNHFGVTAAIIGLFVGLFLYAWVLNAISDYRLTKVKEKLDRDYEEFREKLKGIK